MTNSIKILNNVTMSEIATIENIINPAVYEEINGSYTFSFEVDYRHRSLFVGSNIIDVEGQYFRPTRITTDRGYGINVSVNCEHISYDLIEAEDETEEYEDTAMGMISNVLSGTPFVFGSVVHTQAMYYKPSSKSIRQRLFDIANLFGAELIFDNFTVHMVYRRGVNNNQQLKLGENLVSVQEEIDNTTGMTAYDVDVVDLSNVPGYEFLMSIGLGDTVEVVDGLASIYTIQRVLSRQYNPFTKINPRIQIGNLIRDFTDYMREKEEEKEEEDPTANYLIGAFKVGGVDCLQISGVETDFESVLPDDISTGVDYYVEGEHKGVSITLKSQYKDYHATVTKFYEDGSYQDFNLIGLDMSSWNMPEKNLIALTVTVSQVPWNEVDLEVHKAAVYGVVFNKTYIDAIREFKIGKQNVLKMNALIDTPDLNIEEDITATIDYNLLQEHKGVKFSIKRDFKDYVTYITLLDKNGLPTVYEYDMVKNNLATWNLPRENAMYMLVTVQEKKDGEFDAKIHKKVMYGVKFDFVPIEPLREFKVGEEDCLLLESVRLDKEPSLTDYLAEIPYSKLNEYKGLSLALKREFASYHISIKTINKDGVATERRLSEIAEWSFPTDSVMYLLVTVSQVGPDEFNPSEHRRTYYAVKFVEDEMPPEPYDYWLETLTIGDVDLLSYSDIMTTDVQFSPSSFKTTVEYKEPLQNLSAQLKDEFKDYTMIYAESDSSLIPVYQSPSINGKIEEYKTYPFDGVSYYSILIFEVPLEEFDSEIHKVQSYLFKMKKANDDGDGSKTSGVQYAYVYENGDTTRGLKTRSLRIINNITNFRENFMDESFVFTTDEPTNEYYPLALGLEVYENDLVQVVDGVITALLSKQIG